MTNRFAIGLLLAAASVAIAQETNKTGRVFVTDRTAGTYVESFVTNLPAHIEIRNGTLSFFDAGTNVWTSTESHDWGSWLPSGARSPAPEEAIVLNLPLALQPSGTEWATVGGFSVLALSPGTSMTALGSDAAVTWTFPDGSSWKWRATSSIDIPAMATGIDLVDVDGVECVQIDYGASADSAELTLLRADEFAGVFSAVTNATWTQVDATTRRATIPTGDAPRGFFRARVSESVPAHIESSCPVYFPAGVMVSASDINPIVYDSALVVTNAGKVYRIAAEEVR